MANRKIVAMMIGTIPEYSVSRNKKQEPTLQKSTNVNAFCDPK
jgi:hypothetical protein